MAAQQNNDEDVLDEDTLIPEYIELTEDEEEAVKWLEEIQVTFPDAVDDKHIIEEYPIKHLQSYHQIIEKLVAHIERQNKTITDMAMTMASWKG